MILSILILKKKNLSIIKSIMTKFIGKIYVFEKELSIFFIYI